MAIAPQARVSVVGNGVDLEYFNADRNLDTEPHTCCFVGVLNYAPNIDGLKWFCASVWPAVRASVPDAKFLIVGKSPLRDVRRLAELPGVELHADVPDIRPYLERSRVVVAPLRFARGVQNKVLEAMAMRKAVVVTPQSLQGLHSSAESCLIKAESAPDWSNAIVRQFHNRTYANQVGQSARRFVEQRHAWNACLASLEELISPRPGKGTVTSGQESARSAWQPLASISQ